jgi:hypothetical protein
VTVGDENIVLIGNLHARQPASTPAGAAVAVVDPPGDRTFGDELSSLELVRPQLLSTLAGRATLEVNTDLTGPDSEPISVVLAFSDDHRTFVVDSFPPIQGDAATITQEGEASGTFDPGSGAMTLDIVLRLQTLLGTLGLALRLTTGTASEGIYTVTGVPLDPDTGAITLAGAGRLEGSALNPLDDPLSGQEAKVVVEATLDPIP